MLTGGVYAEIRQAHIVQLFFVIWVLVKNGINNEYNIESFSISKDAHQGI